MNIFRPFRVLTLLCLVFGYSHVTGSVDGIYAGGNRTCEVQGDSVFCFGLNNFGQAPGEVRFSGIKDFDMGEDHNCVVDKDGVFCWGSNSNGQSRPTEDFPRASEVSTGKTHTCIIHDDIVSCWGKEEFGVLDAPSDFADPSGIVSGNRHNCVIDQGYIRCWGDNSVGQLNVPPHIESPTELAAGPNYTCALHEGQVSCWGESSGRMFNIPMNIVNPSKLRAAQGQVCVLDEGRPVCWGYGRRIPRQNNGVEWSLVTDVAVGKDHSCIVVGGKHRCWGKSLYGQAQWPRVVDRATHVDAGTSYTCVKDQKGLSCRGIDDLGNSLAPEVAGDIKELSLGIDGGCIITIENKIQCWGKWHGGAPKDVVAPQGLELGSYAACVTDQGRIRCWGKDFYFLRKLIPSGIEDAIQTSIGSAYACALRTNGFQCWSEMSSWNFAHKVEGVTKISAAQRHVCALHKGRVSCWGDNGQVLSDVPPGLDHVVDMEANWSRACAIQDQRVICWGDDTVKYPLLNLKNPYQLTIGRYHSCVLDDVGVHCWGSNEYGQQLYSGRM